MRPMAVESAGTDTRTVIENPALGRAAMSTSPCRDTGDGYAGAHPSAPPILGDRAVWCLVLPATLAVGPPGRRALRATILPRSAPRSCRRSAPRSCLRRGDDG